jgi:hypothetical protein
MIRVPLLAVAIAAAVAVGLISGVVLMHPFLSLDATVERDIQATRARREYVKRADPHSSI